MALVENDEELTCIPLSFEDRTGHLPSLLADLIHRLRLPIATKAEVSLAAREHGDVATQARLHCSNDSRGSADGTYRGEATAAAVAGTGRWRLEIVSRGGAEGFVPRPSAGS